MNPTEIVFFSFALLLPLVGGGVLLYFLARSGGARGRKDGASGEPTREAKATDDAGASAKETDR